MTAGIIWCCRRRRSALRLQRLDELLAPRRKPREQRPGDKPPFGVLIDEVENAASVRAWTPEQKAACGVVVSLYDGELCVQRGVQKKIRRRHLTAGAVANRLLCMWSPPVCRMQQRYQRAAPEKMSSKGRTGGSGRTG
ncbi:hypothetical protein MJ699_00625 [Klebsiella pneumoniae]|nr:hypothetical protein MJ699_00625 [Klebsiella pneumoniae]